MAYDTQNAFAKILRGELPCFKLYEDEATLAFMDIMPQVDGHALVIPKEAAETLFELSDDGAAACLRTVRKVGRAVQRAMGSPGIVVMQVNGAGVGQTVPHLHFHVLPGSIKALSRPHAAQPEDAEKLRLFAERIVAALAEDGAGAADGE